MNIKTIIIICLTCLSACASEITRTDIQEIHSLHIHVNSSNKLMGAEGNLIGRSPYSFVAYQALRHDERSYVVFNLRQSGKRKSYLVGDGFYLIDKDYLDRSSIKEIEATLIQITKNEKPENEYNHD